MYSTPGPRAPILDMPKSPRILDAHTIPALPQSELCLDDAPIKITLGLEWPNLVEHVSQNCPANVEWHT